MIHSFEPFRTDAVAFLTRLTGVDYTHTDFRRDDWLCATGRYDSGELMGVACCEFKTWFDAHFNIAIEDPRCLTRRVMNALFTATFSRAVRISALIDPSNARAIRQARILGFKEEGFSRLAIEGNRDALLFGMLAEDCRYLVRESHHGLVSKAA